MVVSVVHRLCLIGRIQQCRVTSVRMFQTRKIFMPPFHFFMSADMLTLVEVLFTDLFPFFSPFFHHLFYLFSYLSNHPFLHPFWLKNKPKTHAACVMQCLTMGTAAMKVDCLVDPTGTFHKDPACKTPAMSAKRAKNAQKGVPQPDQVYNAKHAMSASCMQGCASGIPFMFNWTDPMMPGVPVASPNTWMLGLTSHLGPDGAGSLGSGDASTMTPTGSQMSPFNPPSEIAKGPSDRASCISQCLSMGHDAVAAHDKYVENHAPKRFRRLRRLLGLKPPKDPLAPTVVVTEMQKTQMFYTCAKGW